MSAEKSKVRWIICESDGAALPATNFKFKH